MTCTYYVVVFLHFYRYILFKISESLINHELNIINISDFITSFSLRVNLVHCRLIDGVPYPSSRLETSFRQISLCAEHF